MNKKDSPIPSSIYIGTCGWSYKEDWKTVFYPDWLPESQFLEYYSNIFSTNEIDSSFYRIPSQKIVESWVKKTPVDFLFSAKIPKQITHTAKLDLELCENALNEYFQNISLLESKHKMLAHLLQLPPSFSFEQDQPKLEKFFKVWNDFRANQLSKDDQFQRDSWRLVVEFRNNSWMREESFALLKEYQIAYCAVVEPLLPPRMDMTRTDLFYIRFHGYGKNPWFNYLFDDEELEKWASELKNIFVSHPKADKVVYFNNHFSGNAVKNALDIMPKVGVMPLKTLDEVINEFSKHAFNSNIKQKRTKKKFAIFGQGNSLDNWMKKNE